MEGSFGNIKCKHCNEHINPIKLHDHHIECKLKARIEQLEKALEEIAQDAKNHPCDCLAGDIADEALKGDSK